jgi:hypothetical protein
VATELVDADEAAHRERQRLKEETHVTTVHGIGSQPARTQQLAQENLPDLERHLPDPRKGERVVFAYSQGRLELRHQNKVTGTWNDAGLAEALFSTWLGAKPVDADLKQGLLGGECH